MLTVQSRDPATWTTSSSASLVSLSHPFFQLAQEIWIAEGESLQGSVTDREIDDREVSNQWHVFAEFPLRANLLAWSIGGDYFSHPIILHKILPI